MKPSDLCLENKSHGKRRVRFRLPYPPSINTYYRHVGSKVLISKDGRLYREAVERLRLLYSVRPFLGPIGVRILLRQPDQRRRDVDNTLKAVLDALCHAGLYDDDSQIDRLLVVRGDTSPRDGFIVVSITSLEGGD